MALYVLIAGIKATAAVYVEARCFYHVAKTMWILERLVAYFSSLPRVGLPSYSRCHSVYPNNILIKVPRQSRRGTKSLYISWLKFRIITMYFMFKHAFS